MLALATRCCIYIYDIEKHSAVLENAAGLVRLDAYIRSRNKMAALGYVYTLGEQTLHSPERCMSRNATSAEFLAVQIPPCVLVYDLDSWCPVSSARSAQKLGGKNKKKNMKR